MTQKMIDLVESGYNEGRYYEVYRERQYPTHFEKLFLDGFTEELLAGSQTLDVGSGPGIPYDRYLLQKGTALTGIDLSKKHVNLARLNVPEAQYICGNFLDYPFDPDSFDAVMSLYMLFHIPRDMHRGALLKMHNILKRGGMFLVTVGTEDVPYKERAHFCGSTMAWSYFDTQTYLNIISSLGFTILQSLNERDYGSNEKHMWILARKE